MAARKNPSKHNLISAHDHVGNMHFFNDYCFCLECEQEWELTDNGWKPAFGTCLKEYGVSTWKPKKRG